jgi:hypothetical protein
MLARATVAASLLPWASYFFATPPFGPNIALKASSWVGRDDMSR